MRYAGYIKVVGGKHKSRLILKAWSEKEEALLGFYSKFMDGIEKRVIVKIYIDDSIVQQYVHIDEYVGSDKIDQVGTQINDSFVKNSTIGAVGKKCPNFSREVESNEEAFGECGEVVESRIHFNKRRWFYYKCTNISWCELLCDGSVDDLGSSAGSAGWRLAHQGA